jgi:hypothetical protein
MEQRQLLKIVAVVVQQAVLRGDVMKTRMTADL